MSDLANLAEPEDAGEVAEFNAAMSSATSIGGTSGTLVNGKDGNPSKNDLVGLPFLVRVVTYRENGMGEFTPGVVNNFLTLECQVAPLAMITATATQRKTMRKAAKLPEDDAIRFRPMERFILNDGSTGIYRRVTAELHESGAITLNGDLGERSHKGAKGTSIYDEPMEVWEEGDEKGRTGIQVNLMAPNGLRASTYNYQGSDATTYYFA